MSTDNTPSSTGDTPAPQDDTPAHPHERHPRLRRPPLRAVNTAVAAAVVVAGVALWVTRPHLLDADRVAQTIGERISHQVGQPVTVHCPDGVQRRRGETFRCTVTTASGLRRVVVVTVTDDQGTVTWHTQS